MMCGFRCGRAFCFALVTSGEFANSANATTTIMVFRMGFILNTHDSRKRDLRLQIALHIPCHRVCKFV